MDNIEVYNRLKRILDERGITIYKLAKETHLNPSMFSHWKNDKYFPKKDKLETIAIYLNVSLAYLMGATDDPQEHIDEAEAKRKIEFHHKRAEEYRKKAIQLEEEAKELEEQYNQLEELTKSLTDEDLSIIKRLTKLTPEQKQLLRSLISQLENK